MAKHSTMPAQLGPRTLTPVKKRTQNRQDVPLRYYWGLKKRVTELERVIGSHKRILHNLLVQSRKVRQERIRAKRA